MTAQYAMLTPEEERAGRTLYKEEIGSDEFVGGIEEPLAARGMLSGTHRCPGGHIAAYLRVEGAAQNRVREALITGDFFVTPPRVIYDLESSLRGVYLDDLEGVVDDFFRRADVEVLSVDPEDFVAAFRDAIG
jgi:lipoate-protein ligase A